MLVYLFGSAGSCVKFFDDTVCGCNAIMLLLEIQNGRMTTGTWTRCGSAANGPGTEYQFTVNWKKLLFWEKYHCEPVGNLRTENMIASARVTTAVVVTPKDVNIRAEESPLKSLAAYWMVVPFKLHSPNGTSFF